MTAIPMPNTARMMFMDVAWSHLNTPYRWGGDDPMAGFDCSGLVVECLKSIGAIGLREDYGANAMWQKWRGREVSDPYRGVLAFWFDGTGTATHVAICWDRDYCITADGGGSKTLTERDAIEQNAFIKVRRIDHRLCSPKFTNLFVL